MRKINKPSQDDTQNVYSIDETHRLIGKIFRTSTIPELQENVATLLHYIESVDKKRKPTICKNFPDALLQWVYPYSHRFAQNGHNVMLVPPNHAPIIMMSTEIPITTKSTLVINGMKRFAERCNEFVNPIEPTITDDEIAETLDAAQTGFGLIDIIAPKVPLKILRLNHSHVERNAECGILGGDLRQSVIMLYHPRESGIYSNVFIFAHELGHSLHLALTGDINIIPDGYDKINEMLGVSLTTLKEKQEGFADFVAFAILGNGLEKHLPAEFNKDGAPYFVKILKGLLSKASVKE